MDAWAFSLLNKQLWYLSMVPYYIIVTLILESGQNNHFKMLAEPLHNWIMKGKSKTNIFLQYYNDLQEYYQPITIETINKV